MKLNKNILTKLEQLYYTNVNIPRPSSIEDYPDLPNVTDDNEYKTNISIPAAVTDSIELEDFKEPEVKTRKGKTVLNEPPDPESNDIKDVEIIDSKGEEIEDWESDLEDLDRSEIEEMISVFEDSILEQDEKKDKEDEESDAEEDEDDDNGLGKIADDNMGEQNPASGEDPNIDPNQQMADPSAMMGGQSDPSQMGMDGSMGGALGQPDPNIDPMTGQPKKTAEEVGKIFELKKIYSRLLAIESQLSFSSDIILLKLRKFITQSIELFEILISNIDAYKDNMDEIIIMFYNFLQEVYDIMERYYKIQDRKDKNNK